MNICRMFKAHVVTIACKADKEIKRSGGEHLNSRITIYVIEVEQPDLMSLLSDAKESTRHIPAKLELNQAFGAGFQLKKRKAA